jgi:hypothetical protein
MSTQRKEQLVSTHGKLLLAACIAVLAMAIGAGTAAASRSLSVAPEVRLTLHGRLVYESNIGEPVEEITCNVTVTKTLVRAIAKIAGTVMGRVTSIRIAPETCVVGGNADVFRRLTFLRVEAAELWQILYNSFLGSLPRITGILTIIRNVQFLVEYEADSLEIMCLYDNSRRAGSLGLLARVTAAGVIERLNTLNAPEQPATREFDLVRDLERFGFACARTARWKLELAPQQNTSIRLL